MFPESQECLCRGKAGYTNVKVYAEGYPEWKDMYGPGCTETAAATPMAEPKKAKRFKAKFKLYPQLVDGNFVKEVVDQKTVGLVIDARP